MVDSLNEKQASQFKISQRSKGYQWYCNFILKIFYNDQYTSTRSQAIFLLDEPGAYLHPLAQDRLLDKITELSKSNVIIYTTHLPQLVNPAKIRLHDCLVAYRQTSHIILKKYGEMNDEQSYGALTTLNNAIKINIPGLMFPSTHVPFVITEGITESGRLR
jgi:predicted ATP-dependent endonuclease of OLD family